jgi:hypothetical protein
MYVRHEKLAYNGKIEHHWAKHRAQAIALHPANKKDRIRQYTTQKDGYKQKQTHHIRPSRHHAWVG